MSAKVRDVIEWLNTIPADELVYIDDGGLTLRIAGDKARYEVGGHSEDREDNDSGLSVYQCHHCGLMTETTADDIRQVGEPHCTECGDDMQFKHDGPMLGDCGEGEEAIGHLAHCGQPDCPICKAVGLTLADNTDDDPPGEVVIVPKENP